MLHKKALLGDIHKVHNYEYPNESSRDSAILTNEDIGKIAWQKDNDSFWILKSAVPTTWVYFGGVSPDGPVTPGVLEVAVRTAGVVVTPTIVDNGNGSVTIGSGQYSLYTNNGFLGYPNTYTIAGGTFVLDNNVTSYIVANYNSGTPIVEVITSVPPPSQTDATLIPIFTLFRKDNDIHFFNWDNLALGLCEKINQRLRRTERFRIDNGLSLSESATRVINIDSGEMWASANLIELLARNSTDHETHFYYHSSGTWVRSDIVQYNNTQYDNGTNLVTLDNNKYAVNWIYRSADNDGAIYVLLGNGNYSLLEAQASVEPPKPEEIITQSQLVGRIIVEKDANTATLIDRVIDTKFGSSSVVNHNDLTGIQGGTTNEHYHLTLAEYTGTGTGVLVRQTAPVVRYSTRLVTSSASVTTSDYTVRVQPSTLDLTVTLPDVTTIAGQVFVIKKIGDSPKKVIIATVSSQTIDGSLTASIEIPYQSLMIQSNGSSWDII